MKKSIILLIALAVLTLTACKKDSQLNGRFTATTEGYANKTDLNSDGHSFSWHDGDQIRITSANSGSYIFDLIDNQGGRGGFEYLITDEDPDIHAPYTAGYPPAIWNDACTMVTLPSVQNYKSNSLDQFPMYAVSSTENLAFKNLCGVLKLNINTGSTAIDHITIEANQNLSGQFTVSQNNGIPQLTPTNEGSHTVTLVFGEPRTLSASDNLYIYLPAGEYTSFKITTYAPNFLFCPKRANNHIVIERNHITSINFSSSTMNFSTYTPEGGIPGCFTIDDEGHQVYFSKGNLQYIGSAATPYWKFADEQYEYLGTTTNQNSTAQNVDRDLFGWGCTGQNTGATAYQPWATSTTNSQYNIGGSYLNDLEGTSDWGCNPISNGGSSNWRTLTSDQWNHLFFERTCCTTLNGKSNARFCKANVNGIEGYILFPDHIEWPDDVTLPTSYNINNTSSAISVNAYTVESWNTLEQKGCVFLPAAGFRWGTNYYSNSGDYWSSTHGSSTTTAVYMYFSNTSSLSTTSSTSRSYGFSVRLVADLY